MLRRFQILVLAALAAVSVTFSTTTNQAFSAQFETTELFRKGAWFVELTIYMTDNDMWCTAQTANGSGQSFDITIYPSGTIILFVFDTSWALAERPVDFLIDIDRDRWEIAGSAQKNYINARLDDKDEGKQFLQDLYLGNSATVLNAQGDRLARFSLSGSAAAILRLGDCAKRIQKTDPFTTSDPFGPTSDPF